MIYGIHWTSWLGLALGAFAVLLACVVGQPSLNEHIARALDDGDDYYWCDCADCDPAA